MNQLHVIGKQKIGDFEFVAIEGGFGEGKKANAYKNSSINKSAFSNCYSQLKRVFDVASYMDIPKVRYEEAMSLIPKWQPSLELQSKIDTVNGQRNLFEDMEGYQ